MEPENKYDEILIRYSLNECNGEEEKFVSEWLDASEENRLYLQRVVDTLKLLAIKEEINKIDVDQEWQHFQQLKEGNGQKLFQLHKHANEEEETLYDENRPAKKGIYKIVIAAAVAASLIFAIVLAPALFNTEKAGRPVTANKGNGTAGKIDSLMVVILHEENTTDKIKRLGLPDGSHVDLFSNSEITYREPTEKNRREVLLKGKADFKVAKDKTRPFTVFSGDISTTALGTQFTVTAMPFEKQILVQLHEGKVVIKSVDAIGAKHMKNVYLVPGQEMVYSIISKTAMVRSFAAKGKVAKKEIRKEELLNDNPVVPAYGKNSWFMFNNQSLNQIFDALADMYDVRISYSKKKMEKMYFIGTFDKSDSLEFILKQIATINNLTISKDSNTYTIKTQILKQKK